MEKNVKLVLNISSPNAIQLWTFVGKEKETEIVADPNGKLAIEYRKFIRRVVRKNYRPLADLLNMHTNMCRCQTKQHF